MTTTVSEIRVWAGAMTSERLLLEKHCAEVVEKGGSYSVDFLGKTETSDGYHMQRYTINWPDEAKGQQND